MFGLYKTPCYDPRNARIHLPKKDIHRLNPERLWTERRPVEHKEHSVKPGQAQEPAKLDMVNDYQPYVDFRFVYPDIQPTIRDTRDLYMAVLVNSGAKGERSREHRAKIRETWASKSSCECAKAMNDTNLKDLKWILVFVLGRADDMENRRNMAEAMQYNDMIIGNINDNYLNNIMKFYMGQLWASFLGAKYTLKTDDDVYVRVPKVIEYLVSRGSPSRFYAGGTYRNTAVHRLPGGSGA